ncbi:MAG: hypothetical protein ACM3SQ_16420 [Betaproteobacteria bacterium]
MTVRLQRIVIVVLMAACAPRPVSAQTKASWELFGGYALAHVTPDAVTMPAGWEASAAKPVTDWFAAVVDASGSYRTETIFDGTIRLTTHAALAGGRFSARIGRLIEFGQILAGVERTRGTVFGFTDSNTRAALEPDAGLDYPISRTFAARAALGVRLTKIGHEVRFAAGIVYSRR